MLGFQGGYVSIKQLGQALSYLKYYYGRAKQNQFGLSRGPKDPLFGLVEMSNRAAISKL